MTPEERARLENVEVRIAQIELLLGKAIKAATNHPMGKRLMKLVGEARV